MTAVINKRVLLIGGSGFIGKHLTKACISAGMQVRVADAISPIGTVANNDIEYIKGDYRETDFLLRILANVDYVIHLAHDTMLLNIDCNMSLETDRNILPAIHLMDICSTSNIQNLLFVSSGGTVYGNRTTQAPILENSTTRPVSVYGTTKLMIEQLGFLYHAQKNLPFTVARPGNAYGQGQLPFRGQGFVATAFASAHLGRALSVFGDGSIVRDYIHVIDIADALVAILKYGRAGEAYNIGTAIGTSLRTMLENFICPILAKDQLTLNYSYEAGRRADVGKNVLSDNKLMVETGFSPKITLEEGLNHTWEWMKINTAEITKYK
jgi:UDP-glucose 4-epimerase